MSAWNRPAVQCDYDGCGEAVGSTVEMGMETITEFRTHLTRFRGWSTGRSGGVDYCPLHATLKLRDAADALAAKGGTDD